MINHIQLNINNTNTCGFITNDKFDILTEKFKKANNYEKIYNYINKLSIKYYIDINKIILSYLNYIIRNNIIIINSELLKLVEYITHDSKKNNSYTNKFFILSLNDYISEI